MEENRLDGYIENNKGKLERLALHGNNLASAMALTLLEKENQSGE